MKRNHRKWTAPVSGALLLATAAAADQDLQSDLNSTNRVTLSLRFGLNISGKFSGIGGSLNPAAPGGNGRRTSRGDAYNYDNGYVLTDISGNAGNQTWYWGYDSSSQVNSAAGTVAFNRNTAAGLPGETSGGDSTSVGFELAYDNELGVKADWHRMRYGLEGAFNYLPIEFNSGGLYSVTLSQRTDTYGYTVGTTPPSAPYQGSYQGPGFVINVPPVSSTTTLVPGASFLAQDHFDANLWGFRLGPYLEFPLTEKWDLHLSGGLAAAFLAGNASWKETLTAPGGGGPSVITGGGSDSSLLWGFYVGLDTDYQFNRRWGVEGGVQFQDLGIYDHNFGGRSVELDLSRSLFIHAGISYSF